MGFVPTMGALHAGHRSLVEAARRLSDRVVVSIFINPLQFDDPSDLDAYPSDLEGDLALLREVGCDLVFFPSPTSMYPPGFQTKVSVTELSHGLCGAGRPGHFDGVATVVLKLFNIVHPHVAVFGEKDFQQLALIKTLVRDLHLDVEIFGQPIIRDNDGLAMSSRNRRLAPEERQRALVLSKGLRAAAEAFRAGLRSTDELIETARLVFDTEPDVSVEYLEIRSSQDLRPLRFVTEPAVLLVAAKVGSTRLIDNQRLDFP